MGLNFHLHIPPLAIEIPDETLQHLTATGVAEMAIEQAVSLIVEHPERLIMEEGKEPLYADSLHEAAKDNVFLSTTK